jgi:hypothetical protein
MAMWFSLYAAGSLCGGSEPQQGELKGRIETVGQNQMLYASLTAGPDFSDSSVDNKVIFFDFALHNKIVRVDANDILCRF